MVEWLAGNRIRGTTAERPALGLPSPSVGGWVEVGRTTLGSAGDTITVSSLPDKRYYMALCDLQTGGTRVSAFNTFNSDTGTNYASRFSLNGAADGTHINRANYPYRHNSGGTSDVFAVGYTSNLAAKEKLCIGQMVGDSTAGAATAPNRQESVGKWINTTNAISSWTLTNAEAGSYTTGAEVVVLGWDPADTHTTNFWEELASVELGTTANNIDSGTITAKKYLWVQCFIESSGGATNAAVQFNGDTATNYSERLSSNGAADSTATLASSLSSFSTGSADENGFLNFFVINNSANEKLCLGSNVSVSTTGAATAPDRREGVGKWANTSAQITSINISEQTAGTYGAKTYLKVWGSD